MAKKKKPLNASKTAFDESVADRLKSLRTALGYETVPAFARGLLRIDPKRWYNFENGFPLSRDMAILLVQRVPGLTLDWIYFGKADGLPMALARRLGVYDLPPEKA